ncbi:AMP-binding protein [Cupriavidus pauculus]|uniref:AMP-binding protein n=1 Tax=Cupriavidus pauculus TaxID=82633 RepID=UPI001EE31B8A|nr:AMP-binding protein [Cupriavidus pauculus]GJG94372.1 AMP-binding protein [Cupriavidus pauculus]
MPDPQSLPTPVHCLLRREQESPFAVYLTQPQPDGTVLDYRWCEVADEARRMASHLLALDLPPRSAIAILGENSAHWIIADLAIWIAGHVSVTVSADTDRSGVAYVLGHSEARLVFVGRPSGNAARWREAEAAVPQDIPVIRLPQAGPGRGKTWYTIVAATPRLRTVKLPDPAALATIVYVPGSTGRLKGVMHRFRTLCEVPRALNDLLPQQHRRTSADRLLAYLPLSQCAGRLVVECASLCFGYRVFFYDRPDTILQDLSRARPTLFHVIPRAWALCGLPFSRYVPPRLHRWLLAVPGLSRGLRRLQRRRIGLDQARVAFVAGEPVPREVQAWYRAAGLTLIVGYGLPENFGYSHLTLPGQGCEGYVGLCNPGVECRIAGNGEVLVKSPGQMMGYYKASEKTADSLTPDGFFKTRDQGELDALGRLRLRRRRPVPGG